MPKKHKSRSKSKHKFTLKSFKKRPAPYKYILGAFLLAVIGGVIYRAFNPREPNLILPALPPVPADALYKKADAPIEERVNDLLGRMSLEEKIGQMALVDKRSVLAPEDVKIYGLGGVLSGSGAKPDTNNPEEWLKMVEQYKSEATKSRLGIPLFYGIDANHGHSHVLGATVFPHQIGLGASQNANLIKEIGAISARELKATGINWNFSPSLDAPTDIRWGRVYEAFSENNELNSKLGRAFIEGTQQDHETDDFSVTATAKHYLGAGSMVWGESNHRNFKIDQGKVPEDENALFNDYLPPYKAAVDGQVGSVMVALSQYGDSRIIDNRYLLTDLLKNELGFKGFIVSDWYGVYEYDKTSDYKANIRTINAGLDMAMLPYKYKTFIYDVRKAVNENKISQSRIDDAVRRILYQKFAAGLFEHSTSPVPNSEVGSDQNRSVARKAVAASAVLLKNSGDLLPLSKSGGSILVAGSGADNVGRQSGAWTVEWQGVDGNWIPGATSILEGMKNVVGNNGRSINYKIDGNFNRRDKADVGIAVISEKPYAEGWGDNEYPTIDKNDLLAIENLKKNSKKVVVVMVSGRPLFISDHASGWDGIVAAWLPGSEGAGLADVIFGDTPFSGKLPITWPKNVNQIPVFSGTTADGSEPLFKYGFGLTAGSGTD
jgi:beta-glucosidase